MYNEYDYPLNNKEVKKKSFNSNDIMKYLEEIDEAIRYLKYDIQKIKSDVEHIKRCI